MPARHHRGGGLVAGNSSCRTMGIWHCLSVPLSARTHITGVISSSPPCVTLKTPSARKAAGNHLMNSTSPEKTQITVSGFCYARNRVCNAVICKICRFTALIETFNST